MNKFHSIRSAIYNHSIRSAIYNKVWGRPKSALGAYLRRKCDSIPANRRLTLITVLLSLFIITAFFVFGNDTGHFLTQFGVHVKLTIE